MRFLLALAAAALLASAPAPALADDAGCIWSQLSPALQRGLIDYAKAVYADPSGPRTDPADPHPDIMRACGIVAGSEDEGIEQLGVLIIEKAMRETLAERHSIPPARLATAWAGLPAADREHLKAMASLWFFDDGEPDERAMTIIRAAGGRLRIPPDGFIFFMEFMLSHAVRDGATIIPSSGQRI